MPRAALPVGAWGAIVSRKDAKTGKRRASCRFKDMDGVTRTYSKFAATKGKAENALLTAMKERQDQGRQPVENISFGESQMARQHRVRVWRASNRAWCRRSSWTAFAW